MTFYPILRKGLFCLPPEIAHRLTLNGLQLAYRLHLLRKTIHPSPTERIVMGHRFPNLIGLAAGLDRDAQYIDALSMLGFGYLEVGTIMPHAHPGNPKPRLFRLVKQEALINRIGFSSQGIEPAIERLSKIRYRGILGINICKNKTTPLLEAAADYVLCFQKLWPFASYITINISSPNMPQLRNLQHSDLLYSLLSALKKEQQHIALTKKRYVPLVVKLSPDLLAPDLQSLAAVLLEQKIDGVIATNTTLSREGVSGALHANEVGGLSGKPLQTKSTQMIRQLYALLQDHIPIIGCGGVMDAQSAQEKLQAGAQLLQLYTGFIYHGPALIKTLSMLGSVDNWLSQAKKEDIESK